MDNLTEKEARLFNELCRLVPGGLKSVEKRLNATVFKWQFTKGGKPFASEYVFSMQEIFSSRFVENLAENLAERWLREYENITFE